MKSHLSRRITIRPPEEKEARKVQAELVETRALTIRALLSDPHEPFVPDEKLTFERYLQIAYDIARAQKFTMWKVGDFLVYGHHTFDDKQMAETIQALSTVYSLGTLDAAWRIAEAFAPNERNLHLSWNHHQAVKALSKSDRKHWLREAERRELSYREMYGEIQHDRRKRQSRTAPGPVASLDRFNNDRLLMKLEQANDGFFNAYSAMRLQWNENGMFDRAAIRPPAEELRDTLNEFIAALGAPQRKKAASRPSEGARATG